MLGLIGMEAPDVWEVDPTIRSPFPPAIPCRYVDYSPLDNSVRLWYTANTLAYRRTDSFPASLNIKAVTKANPSPWFST
jgi:hypothetical protein